MEFLGDAVDYDPAGALQLAAAVQLQGLTGTKQGQSGTLSTSSESEASRIAK